MKRLNQLIFRTPDDRRSLLPRLVVGLIFLSEGIQKFIYPELTGAGRFEKIGFSNPEFLASFVASFEIICGFLILIGLAVRVAAIPLFIIMFTAIITTKIPILTGQGFWQMAHDSRTDFAMIMLILFLFIYGAGKFSVDHRISRKLKSQLVKR